MSDPNYFYNGDGNGPIVKLAIRSWDSGLFLGTPRNQVVAKKNKITIGWSVCFYAWGSINIRVSQDDVGVGTHKSEPTIDCALR